MKNHLDFTDAVWNRSDYSDGGDNCLEVSFHNGVVAFRDSNDADDPTIRPTVISEQDYRLFVKSIQDGQRDLLLP
ncbi:DUF397 domain-containing protein [Streptomyces sp. NPDC003077]|uniref:DUF397 domain-containing protein n=1 Tax=Streptomyces sp. NPDC003077 TaxID=3154443 RepID=UPI0033B29C83